MKQVPQLLLLVHHHAHLLAACPRRLIRWRQRGTCERHQSALGCCCNAPGGADTSATHGATLKVTALAHPAAAPASLIVAFGSSYTHNQQLSRKPRARNLLCGGRWYALMEDRGADSRGYAPSPTHMQHCFTARKLSVCLSTGSSWALAAQRRASTCGLACRVPASNSLLTSSTDWL